MTVMHSQTSPAVDLAKDGLPIDPELRALEKRRLARIAYLSGKTASLVDDVSDCVLMADRIKALLEHAAGTLCEAKDYGLAMIAEEMAAELAVRLDGIVTKLIAERSGGSTE